MVGRHSPPANKKRRRIIATVAALLGIGSGMAAYSASTGNTPPPDEEEVAPSNAPTPGFIGPTLAKKPSASPSATAKATPKPTASAKPKPTVKPTPRPVVTPKPVVKPTPKPTPRPPVVNATKREEFVAWLLTQVGKPYVYGATGPEAYDCSGLVQTGLARVGFDTARDSEDQSLVGTEVSLSALQPGDILFWGGVGTAYHEAVYIGNGKYVAAENRRDGVMIFSMSWSRPDFARRVL